MRCTLKTVTTCFQDVNNILNCETFKSWAVRLVQYCSGEDFSEKKPVGYRDMQHVFKNGSNTYSDERATLSFNKEHCQNFAETLPTEMSLKIFNKLDTPSLCNALQTCKLWYHIIEDSDHIWRDHCLVVRAVCQREIDGDRQGGMPWKITLVRNYKRSFLKRDWLRGRYSNVRCADELRDTYMCPLDVETWGEILEAELER